MSARECCPVCGRPERACYCRFVNPVSTRTKVLILQHPRESRVAINTARIARLCLPGAEIRVGIAWEPGSEVADTLADPSRTPHSAVPRPQCPRHPRARIRQARHPGGHRRNLVPIPRRDAKQSPARRPPSLRVRPRPRERVPDPARTPPGLRVDHRGTRARARRVGAKQRTAGATHASPSGRWSTFSSRALRANTSPGHDFVRSSKSARRKLPRLLTDRREDLVCVVAEANAWPRSANTHPSELVHWLAYRPGDGCSFRVHSGARASVEPEYGGLIWKWKLRSCSRDRLRRSFDGHGGRSFATATYSVLGGTSRSTCCERPADTFLGSTWTYGQRQRIGRGEGGRRSGTSTMNRSV